MLARYLFRDDVFVTQAGPTQMLPSIEGDFLLCRSAGIFTEGFKWTAFRMNFSTNPYNQWHWVPQPNEVAMKLRALLLLQNPGELPQNI